MPVLQIIVVHPILLCIHTIASTPYSFVYILTCFTDTTCPLNTPLYTYLPVLQTVAVHSVLLCIYTYLFYRQYLSTLYYLCKHTYFFLQTIPVHSVLYYRFNSWVWRPQVRQTVCLPVRATWTATPLSRTPTVIVF